MLLFLVLQYMYLYLYRYFSLNEVLTGCQEMPFGPHKSHSQFGKVQRRFSFIHFYFFLFGGGWVLPEKYRNGETKLEF